MKAVLSIAGSDPSGGAGIQADLKTIAAHRLFGETAITALTAQNTLGVYGVEDADPNFVAAQIDAVFDDIYPSAVKIGMVSSVAIIKVIADRLTHWDAKNIVVDPVMVATSGGKLISDEAIDALMEYLIPLADIITPNLPEAEVLCGRTLTTEDDMASAALELASRTKCAALVKGGHIGEAANDVLAQEKDIVWLREERIGIASTHGTGCTLSSALACNLAQDLDVEASARKAKSYVTGALRSGLSIGKGSMVLDHMWEYRENYAL